MRHRMEENKTTELLVVRRNCTLFGCVAVIISISLSLSLLFSIHWCANALLPITGTGSAWVYMFACVCVCVLLQCQLFCWPFILFSLSEPFVSVNDFYGGYECCETYPCMDRFVSIFFTSTSTSNTCKDTFQCAAPMTHATETETVSKESDSCIYRNRFTPNLSLKSSLWIMQLLICGWL